MYVPAVPWIVSVVSIFDAVVVMLPVEPPVATPVQTSDALGTNAPAYIITHEEAPLKPNTVQFGPITYLSLAPSNADGTLLVGYIGPLIVVVPAVQQHAGPEVPDVPDVTVIAPIVR